MEHQFKSGNDRPIKKIRVGIIGAGNSAKYGHIPSMKLLPDYDIVAIQSRRKEASEIVAKNFEIGIVVDSVAELVSLPIVDMVAVLTTVKPGIDGQKL